jgi:hypothetical protein
LLVKKYREFWQAASNYSKNYHFTDPGDLNCDQSRILRNLSGKRKEESASKGGTKSKKTG